MKAELLRFALVGVVNTLLGFTAIALLQEVVGLDAMSSNVGGFAIGAVCSYFLNRTFTFRSQRPHTRAAPIFVLLILVCLALNLATLDWVLESSQVHPLVAQAMAIAVYNVCFFLGSKLVVFRG